MSREHQEPRYRIARARVTHAIAAAVLIACSSASAVNAQPAGQRDDDDELTFERRTRAITSAAQPASESDDGDDDELPIETRTRVVAGAPPIASVLTAAYRAAGLDRDIGRSFARRARLGGLVPWVTLRAGNTTSWHDDDPDVGRGRSLEARATWRLDRLVFDGRELQVAAMTAARRRERRRLAARVIKAYFTWRRATMAGSLVRAEESEAELDALTDGWFTEARRTASGGRTACSVLSSPGAATP
jgi:hypothetical protein